jgi:hypothetical protein
MVDGWMGGWVGLSGLVGGVGYYLSLHTPKKATT